MTAKRPGSAGTGVTRVAQIARPAAGGIRRHVSLLCAHLDRRQFAPSLYAPADFTLDLTSEPSENVPQHRLEIASRTRIAADLRAVSDAARQLRGRTDLVHAHGLRAALIGVPSAKLAGVPSLFTAHNLLPPTSRLQRVLLRHIGRATNAIIAVSQAVADTLTDAGVPAANIHVIPNGIPTTQYRSRDFIADNMLDFVPEGAVVVLAIGRLSPEKGFDVLLDAFPYVLANISSACLLLAGDGPEADSLRTQAQNSPAVSHIQFLGRVVDVVPLLHRAQVVAIPSRQEGQGLVALEAMAAGLPVVASRVGGLKETVVDGVTGLLVPPDDPRALASALVQILRDTTQGRIAPMRQQATQRAEQLYTVERMILNIENVYRSLAG